MKTLPKSAASLALALFWVLTLLAGASPGAVDNPGTIKVGGQKIAYDQIYEDDTDQDQVKDRKSYYLKDNLVLTAWDTNKDGRDDLWFVYDGEQYLNLEAADLDFNGTVDELTHLDRNENVTGVERPGKGDWLIPGLAAAGLAVAAGAVMVRRIRIRRREASAREVAADEE